MKNPRCWYCHVEGGSRVGEKIWDLNELLTHFKIHGKFTGAEKPRASEVQVFNLGGDLIFKGDASNPQEWSSISTLRSTLYDITGIHSEAMQFIDIESGQAKIMGDADSILHGSLYVHFGVLNTPMKVRHRTALPTLVSQPLICKTCRAKNDKIIALWTRECNRRGACYLQVEESD